MGLVWEVVRVAVLAKAIVCVTLAGELGRYRESIGVRIALSGELWTIYM